MGDNNELILKRIEKNFDKILFIGAIFSWLSAIAVYFSPITNTFVWYDFIVGVILFALFLLRHRVEISTKITITIFIPLLIGVLSFLDGGFGSAGLPLIMISNVIGVLYLSKRRSLVISYVSIGTIIGLYAFIRMSGIQMPLIANDAMWIINIFMFILYLVILHKVVYSIRDFLLENIDELKHTMEYVFNLAYYDTLTGLANAHQFHSDLKKRITKEKSGFILVFNISNLSMINSIYGEIFGDKVLAKFASELESLLNEGEFIARIGGNEFAGWFLHEDKASLISRIETMQTILVQRLKFPHMTKKVEFFISFKEHVAGEDIEENYQKSKIALTYAKTHSTLGVIEYGNDLDQHLRHDMVIIERLEKALEEESFRAVYQPKISVRTHEIVSVEALARWTDEVLGAVSPCEFIPALEDMNQIVAFGEIMTKKIFMDFRRIRDAFGQNMSISLNISPAHLIADGFLEKFIEMAKAYEVDLKRVIIEVTEEVFIDNFAHVHRVILDLKKQGIRVSLDDFGSGYSSLGYLTKLEIDELKVDKSFVSQLVENPKVNQMFKTIITLGAHYNLNIVAEGVETKTQYEFIEQTGCHEIQGYYCHKPLDLNALEKLSVGR